MHDYDVHLGYGRCPALREGIHPVGLATTPLFQRQVWRRTYDCAIISGVRDHVPEPRKSTCNFGIETSLRSSIGYLAAVVLRKRPSNRGIAATLWTVLPIGYFRGILVGDGVRGAKNGEGSPGIISNRDCLEQWSRQVLRRPQEHARSYK